MPLTYQDITDALQPELDNLLDALDVEPDERQAFANASLALFARCERLIAEHDLNWPPDATLAVVEVACTNLQMYDHAAAIHTIRDYHVSARGEQAKLN